LVLVTALLRSFAVVTAPVLSWAVPTLERGSADTAAMLVPPRATRSASEAMTVAGDGGLSRRCSILASFGVLFRLPKVPRGERNVRNPA
jgi:hypothetical protein